MLFPFAGSFEKDINLVSEMGGRPSLAMAVSRQSGSTLFNLGNKFKCSCWEQVHLQSSSFNLAIKHKPSSCVCSPSSSLE